MGWYCSICKVNDNKIHVHRKRKIEDLDIENSHDSGSGD